MMSKSLPFLLPYRMVTKPCSFPAILIWHHAFLACMDTVPHSVTWQ